MEEKTEGILLHSIPYLGKQKILKVFTPSEGLISLIVKKVSLSALTDPFCLAEWVYKKGREEIHTLKDGTLLDDFSALRLNYETLSTAGAIAKGLLNSQFPANKGRGLYALVLAYLQKLPLFHHPQTLLASFRLKLLLHEGLLSLQNECAHCKILACCLVEGESSCLSHAGSRSFVFDSDEWESLQILTFARQFTLLHSLVISEILQKKITHLFEERINS